jgi:uncharacterized protein (DUF302 family)
MDDTERRQFLKIALAGAGLTLTGTAAGQRDGDLPGEQEEIGLVTVTSEQSFDAAVERLRTTIQNSENLTLVTTIDHAANAEAAGLELRPTTLFVFGNPQLGTQLMQSSQSAGIDLPQKLLVWQTEDGVAKIAWNDPEWIAERHGIDPGSEVITIISSTLRRLATGRSGNT